MQTYILALIVSVGKCIFFIGRFLIKENWFLFFFGGGGGHILLTIQGVYC
jgi:hypothetical protein